MWLLALIFLLSGGGGGGVTGSLRNPPCPPKLASICNCTEIGSGLDIRCDGDDLVAITDNLPPETTEFHYVARELFVQLAKANFSHVPRLKSLSIKDPQDENLLIREVYSMSGNDLIFQGLTELQKLAINVNWRMGTRHPRLFTNLNHLETLDLSNTRRINIDNLIESLQGLRNNTRLRVLNLWNIKTLETSSPSLELDLGQVLEPLQHAPLEVLNIGYNALRSVRPGLLQYAPRLKNIVASNNALIPIITSSLMTEVLLHKTLQEADFSEQGFRPTDLQPLPAFSKARPGPISRSALLEALTGDTEQPSSEFSVSPIPIPPLVRNFIKKFLTCFILLYEDTCNIEEPECKPVGDILSKDHNLFCTLLNFFFRWHFEGIHCTSLPHFEDLINSSCGACLVIPSLGSLKVMKMSELNVYDYVLQFQNYRDRPLCFYPNTSLEVVDLSNNVAHGYPELRRVFYADIRGLENLRFINCSHNGLDELYENITSNFPQLRMIDASYNELTLAGDEYFDIGESVEELLLSHNRIGQIARDKLTKLSNLRVLDLSYNELDDVTLTLAHATGLRRVDLRGNSMMALSQFTMDQLDAVAENRNSSEPILVHLGDNNLICTCSTKGFLDWLFYSHHRNLVIEDMQGYVCANSDSDLVEMNKVSMGWITFQCYENYVYGVLGAVAMLLIVAMGFAYRKRFKIRHKIYRLKKRILRRDLQYRRRHEFDAFILHDDEARDWVEDTVKRRLEPKFKIQIYADIHAGANANDEVQRFIETSYRAIIVLSPSFLETEQRMFQALMVETKMVRSGNNDVIVVVRTPIRWWGLESVLERLMGNCLCLEWVEKNEDAQEYFWERLTDAIGAPVEELYDTSSVGGPEGGESDEEGRQRDEEGRQRDAEVGGERDVEGGGERDADGRVWDAEGGGAVGGYREEDDDETRPLV